MKRCRLLIAPIVQRQILEQVLYIARDSIENALAWETRLRDAIRALADVTGYAVDEDASDRIGIQVRKLVFEGTYPIHFALDEAAGRVEVINFRHGARLPTRSEP